MEMLPMPAVPSVAACPRPALTPDADAPDVAVARVAQEHVGADPFARRATLQASRVAREIAEVHLVGDRHQQVDILGIAFVGHQ